MTDASTKRARELAEARFSRPTQEDKNEAMTEYKAKAEALHDRTARLRKLRLEREAQDQRDSQSEAQRKARKPAVKRQKTAGRRG